MPFHLRSKHAVACLQDRFPISFRRHRGLVVIIGTSPRSSRYLVEARRAQPALPFASQTRPRLVVVAVAKAKTAGRLLLGPTRSSTRGLQPCIEGERVRCFHS